MIRIPTITKNLLIINVIAFIASFVLKRVGIDLDNILGLHFFMASDFHLYQLITYMFMHGGIQHIVFNMFALWMFGCVIENVWGPKKFLFYYILCGIGAGVMQEIAQLVSFYFIATGASHVSSISDLILIGQTNANALNAWTTIGASGAVYAILLAFGMLFPEEKLFIFPLPIPIKAKWFVIFYVVIELVSALATPGDQVAHFAHLGGMLFGFILIRYWQKHPTIGYNGYGQSMGHQFFDRLKTNWDNHTKKKPKNNSDKTYNADENKDWEYNARKKVKQEEIDRILDKVRRSGYDSLSKEEKQKLFDSSRNNNA
ncbi:rhomboid family intramembrane serine protease [Xylanibacter oryzae]|uniref:rhomboid family intramembrane serine protease n=1 Tax=Xylanibacter oryzae TaxID=185293 RepID=UPI0004AF64FF|nr:rhomboid family intramembrane serine protease [Xylanibacter oryzae]